MQGAATADILADTVKVACVRMGISPATFYREVEGGRLVICKVGRRTLVERAEQARWLASCRIEPAIPAELKQQLAGMSATELQALVDSRGAGQAAASNR